MSLHCKQVHVGERLFLSEAEEVEVHFHDFLGLEKRTGEFIDSPDFICHGRKWFVQLYPGGDNQPSLGHNNVSLYLCSRSRARACFTMKVVGPQSNPAPTFQSNGFGVGRAPTPLSFEAKTHTFDGSGKGWGTSAFKRYEVEQNLQNGTLSIRIKLQVFQKAEAESFRLQDTFAKDVKSFLMGSPDTRTVTFLVGSLSLKAQLGFLHVRAPVMAELFLDENTHEVVINNVEEGIFKALLDFVNGEETPSPLLKSNPCGVLTAANRFGVWQLKVLAELELIESLDRQNAVELLLLSDSNCCAFLKERALKEVMADFASVQKSQEWPLLTASHSLMIDIVNAVTNVNCNEGNKEKSVKEMYLELQAKGLPLDGTKDILLQRLRDHDDGQSVATGIGE